ncbi:cysteine-rich receptor kinase 10, partial [Olea europaea subsp. europaea]
MSAFKSSYYVLLLCLFFFFSTRRVTSLNYLYNNCENSAIYSPDSTYEANLNQLFLNLSSTNATQNNGFYSAAVGRGSSDTVYGLFLCRGDVNADICKECVNYATTEILQRCYNRPKGATIWYDECMLRYSNQSIVSRVQQSAGMTFYNVNNITNEPDRFKQMLADTMNEIATEASNNVTGKKFATKEVNFMAFRDYTPWRSAPQIFPSVIAIPVFEVLSQVYLHVVLIAKGQQFFPPAAILGNEGISTKVIVAIVAPVVLSLVLFFIGICFFIKRKKDYDAVNEEREEENEISMVESLKYDLNTIQLATNNFSLDNKIGEGGFGAVYKGTFPNGQEIAVKRLSQSSRQGSKEFTNEVVLVAKLQHRNLVRLLGFCLEGEEKILVYEFVPNKSLDYFLFDPEKGQILDWSKLYKIIRGIARGMVYLHEDSRLRIIHRDLKASNILLDGDMNPKISDFGMARLFGVDQSQENTNRIVGTYGYMSPEYAMHGQFSVKSDVFSFGVIVLEIISGRKNSSFNQSDDDEVLISYAWKLWRDRRALDLMDPTMKDKFDKNEVIRCLQIGLLCVQEDVDERPNMTSVILTLNSHSATLVVPRQPAFFLGSTTQSIRMGLESDKSTSTSTALSTNE